MASCAKHWHFVYSPQSSFVFFIQRKIMAFLQRCIQLFLTIRAVRLNLRWSHRGVWLSWHFVLIEVVTNKNYIYIYDDPNIWFPPCVRLTELNPHKGPNIYIYINPYPKINGAPFTPEPSSCLVRFVPGDFFASRLETTESKPKQHLLLAQLFHMYTVHAKGSLIVLLDWNMTNIPVPISKKKGGTFPYRRTSSVSEVRAWKIQAEVFLLW